MGEVRAPMLGDQAGDERFRKDAIAAREGAAIARDSGGPPSAGGSSERLGLIAPVDAAKVSSPSR